jgi:hypothetical protein
VTRLPRRDIDVETSDGFGEGFPMRAVA